MEIAVGLGIVREKEAVSKAGAWYSIYRADSPKDKNDRARFVTAAAEFGAIELELAATAAFLYAEEGYGRTVKAIRGRSLLNARGAKRLRRD